MTVFSGGDAIKEFFEEFDSWMWMSATVYLHKRDGEMFQLR